MPATLDNRMFLDFLFQTLLERDGDPGGIAFWGKKLQSGELSRHQVALQFILSAEFGAKTGFFRASFDDLARFDVFGTKLFVPRDSDAYNELAHGGYEPWVLPYFHELCQPGMVILDVGASLGNFAIPAAKKVGPTGLVFAVEVSERNARLLLRNALENELTNIRILPVAASDEVGFALLPMQDRSNNNVLAPTTNPEIEKLQGSIVVPVVPLDRLLSVIARIDIIKIDIEGMEYKAVKGASAILQRSRPVMFIEYSPRFQERGSGVKGRELLLELLKPGYIAEILHRNRSIEQIDSPNPEQTARAIDAAWHRHVSEEGGTHLDLCFRPDRR
ncbi:MAG: FkbM family methyltransferase [Acidobacteria bacterium]|nr:FkbM family methyltransferase [Acidobacteriota bacterium]